MMLLASGEELADENPSLSRPYDEYELTQPAECACGFAKPNRTGLHPVVSVPCVDMLNRRDEKPRPMRLTGSGENRY
jgi:hypothetical protein